ncbi:hypothetical protein KKF84_10225 [Myxococcota bacterium]|nr:hypothetical protein [Myxococcota bacterium]MBU1535687.1 hypothetical protein [Myxococcota bacterium]
MKFLFLLTIIFVVACSEEVSSSSECGDNVLDVGEECDGTNTGGAQCSDHGFYYGPVSCNDDCTLDLSLCSNSCGDGVLDGSEECDDEKFGGVTCQTLGYNGGVLACTLACTFDVTDCQSSGRCGDGTIDELEDCEGEDLNGSTCEDLGFDGGTLRCASDCSYDDSFCLHVGCGDFIQAGNEECDGTDYGGQSCGTLGYYGGDVTCNENCTLDISDCESHGWCGDGTANGDEECDADDLMDQACSDLGYHGGALTCSPACELILTDCYSYGTCGDGIVNEPYETCDGSSMGAFSTCEDNPTENYYNGTHTPTCTPECTVDFGDCPLNGSCGDGIRQAAYEECEGAFLGSATCGSVNPGSTGTLTCNANCSFNTSLCTGTCDGAALEPGEMCDGSLFPGGQDCGDYGYNPGPAALTCVDCESIDDSSCVSNGYCGDNILQSPYEKCDYSTAPSCTSLGYEAGTTAPCVDCEVDTSACHNTSPGIVGDACTSVAQCDEFTGTTLNNMCLTSLGGSPVLGGYCTAVCTGISDHRCAVNGGLCMPNPINSLNYCMKPCRDNADCTRTGYTCHMYIEGSGTYYFCMP